MTVERQKAEVQEELSAEEQELYEALEPAFEQERLRIARLLANKTDDELFGQTEFDLRDRVLALGACSLEAAAGERQKKGWIQRC